MREGAFEEGRLPALNDHEAAAEEGIQAELANDEGGVGEHVPRRDDAADGHGYGPEEVIGSANGDSVSRVSENDPDAAEPDTDPAIESAATVPSKMPSPGTSKWTPVAVARPPPNRADAAPPPRPAHQAPLTPVTL